MACSSHSPFTWTAGAPPQAARHSASLTVNFPSAVVPPGSMPSFLQVCPSSFSAPPRAQESVVHTSMTVSPFGSRRNIV